MTLGGTGQSNAYVVEVRTPINPPRFAFYLPEFGRVDLSVECLMDDVGGLKVSRPRGPDIYMQFDLQLWRCPYVFFA